MANSLVYKLNWLGANKMKITHIPRDGRIIKCTLRKYTVEIRQYKTRPYKLCIRDEQHKLIKQFKYQDELVSYLNLKLRFRSLSQLIEDEGRKE